MIDRAKKNNKKRSLKDGGADGQSSKHNSLYFYQDLFLKYLSTVRRLAPNTYDRSYRYDLNSFVTFISKKNIKDLRLIDTSDIRDYISWCRSRHLSSRHTAAGSRPRALEGGICATFTTSHRWTVRRKPQPAATLLPIPGGN